MALHTTVSVTKGIGIAALGGIAGVALCEGGYCGIVENGLATLKAFLLKSLELRMRGIMRDMMGSSLVTRCCPRMNIWTCAKAWWPMSCIIAKIWGSAPLHYIICPDVYTATST